MNLNIIRRHSLEGLGEGWTKDTYVRVEASSTTEVAEWDKAGLLDLVGEAGFNHLRELMKKKIKGGKVLHTNEDGTTEVKEFGPRDVSDLIAALPNAIIHEIFQTSLGFHQPN